jgi:glutamate racemase
MTVGICDWGIGGLGLYELLKRARPDVGVTYIGDQGSVAYSLLTRTELAERVEQMLLAFRRLGVDRVVFACDEASTALGEVSVPNVTATGVIDPTLRSMRSKKYREVGVIGGRRTVLSGAYGRALRKQRFCVLQRVSDDLSIEIEQGLSNESRTHELLSGVLEPLAKVDCLLLACTHYRLVSRTIREILPFADIVDPIEQTVAELVQSLEDSGSPSRSDAFYTTGDPAAMKQRAAETYGLNIGVESLNMARPSLAASIELGFELM